MKPKPQLVFRLTAITLAAAAVIGGAAELGLPGFSHLSIVASAATGEVPVFHPSPIPETLKERFAREGFKLDPLSGNYMGPRLSARTLREPMVPVEIDGRYVKDARGNTVFLRESIRDKLERADAAMYKHKKKHLVVVYGFRANLLQDELYQKIHGHGKVAPAGMSFHETGMALDLGNWRDAQPYMIDAGFVGGCFGLEEDMVHYSVNEITKASNFQEFKRCSFREIPQDVLKEANKLGIGAEKGAQKVGSVITEHFPFKKKQD